MTAGQWKKFNLMISIANLDYTNTINLPDAVALAVLTTETKLLQ